MNTITYPQIQAIEPTANMKSQDAINKRHRIQGGIMFIGGLVFAAAITAYAYNGDTNIFTFIGVAITLAGLVRLPQTESPVEGWSEHDHSNDLSNHDAYSRYQATKEFHDSGIGSYT